MKGQMKTLATRRVVVLKINAAEIMAGGPCCSHGHSKACSMLLGVYHVAGCFSVAAIDVYRLNITKVKSANRRRGK